MACSQGQAENEGAHKRPTGSHDMAEKQPLILYEGIRREIVGWQCIATLQVKASFEVKESLEKCWAEVAKHGGTKFLRKT